MTSLRVKCPFSTRDLIAPWTVLSPLLHLRASVAIDGQQWPSSFALSASARRTSFSLSGKFTCHTSDMTRMLIPCTRCFDLVLEPRSLAPFTSLWTGRVDRCDTIPARLHIKAAHNCNDWDKRMTGIISARASPVYDMPIVGTCYIEIQPRA